MPLIALRTASDFSGIGAPVGPGSRPSSLETALLLCLAMGNYVATSMTRAYPAAGRPAGVQGRVRPPENRRVTLSYELRWAGRTQMDETGVECGGRRHRGRFLLGARAARL